MIFFAHRGARGQAPENTLLAFGRALELGAQWIELDVYPVENHLVVFHDLRLERTTNGSGFVWQQPLAALRALDAGQGEKIPLLTEVFDLVGPEIGINIELKGVGSAKPLVDLLRPRLAQQTLRPETCLVSSFIHDELRAFRTLMPEIPIGALTSSRPVKLAHFAEELGAYSVHVAIDCINREFVVDAHGRGLKVFVYTVNHPAELAWMRELGVDGVFTDYPDRIPGAGDAAPPEPR